MTSGEGRGGIVNFLQWRYGSILEQPNISLSDVIDVRNLSGNAQRKHSHRLGRANYVSIRTLCP